MKNSFSVMLPTLTLTLAAVAVFGPNPAHASTSVDLGARNAMTIEGVKAPAAAGMSLAAPLAEPVVFPGENEMMMASPIQAMSAAAALGVDPGVAPSGAARAVAVGAQVSAQQAGFAAAEKSGTEGRQLNAMFDASLTAARASDASAVDGAASAGKAPSAAQSVWEAFSVKYGDKKTGFKFPANPKGVVVPKGTDVSRIYVAAIDASESSDFGGASLHELKVAGRTVYAVNWSVDTNWGPDAGYRTAIFDKNGKFIAGYYNNTGTKGDKGVVYDASKFTREFTDAAKAPSAASVALSSRKAFIKKYGMGLKLDKETVSSSKTFPQSTSISRISKIARYNVENSDFATTSLREVTLDGKTMYALSWKAGKNWSALDGSYVALFDKNGAFLWGHYEGMGGKDGHGLTFEANQFVAAIGGEKGVLTSTGKIVRRPGAMKSGASYVAKLKVEGPSEAVRVWKAFAKAYGAGFNLPKKTESFAYSFPKKSDIGRVNKVAQYAAEHSDHASASVHKLELNGKTVYAVRWAASLNWTPADGYYLALFNKNGTFITGYYNGLGSSAQGLAYDEDQFLKKIN